jgi:hypothetical protein
VRRFAREDGKRERRKEGKTERGKEGKTEAGREDCERRTVGDNRGSSARWRDPSDRLTA